MSKEKMAISNAQLEAEYLTSLVQDAASLRQSISGMISRYLVREDQQKFRHECLQKTLNCPVVPERRLKDPFSGEFSKNMRLFQEQYTAQRVWIYHLTLSCHQICFLGVSKTEGAQRLERAMDHAAIEEGRRLIAEAAAHLPCSAPTNQQATQRVMALHAGERTLDQWLLRERCEAARFAAQAAFLRSRDKAMNRKEAQPAYERTVGQLQVLWTAHFRRCLDGTPLPAVPSALAERPAAPQPPAPLQPRHLLLPDQPPAPLAASLSRPAPDWPASPRVPGFPLLPAAAAAATTTAAAAPPTWAESTARGLLAAACRRLQTQVDEDARVPPGVAWPPRPDEGVVDLPVSDGVDDAGGGGAPTAADPAVYVEPAQVEAALMRSVKARALKEACREATVDLTWLLARAAHCAHALSHEAALSAAAQTQHHLRREADLVGRARAHHDMHRAHIEGLALRAEEERLAQLAAALEARRKAEVEAREQARKAAEEAARQEAARQAEVARQEAEARAKQQPPEGRSRSGSMTVGQRMGDVVLSASPLLRAASLARRSSAFGTNHAPAVPSPLVTPSSASPPPFGAPSSASPSPRASPVPAPVAAPPGAPAPRSLSSVLTAANKLLSAVGKKAAGFHTNPQHERLLKGGAQLGLQTDLSSHSLFGAGGTFLRHQTRGRPVERILSVTDDMATVECRDRPGRKPIEVIPAAAIYGLMQGQSTPNFQRRSGAAGRENQSFSLLATEGRSFDLEAQTVELKDQFYQAFDYLVQQAQAKMNPPTLPEPSPSNQMFRPTLSPQIPGKSTVFEEYVCVKTSDGHDFICPVTILAYESKRIRQMFARGAAQRHVITVAAKDRLTIEAGEPDSPQ
ncbi:hypothetical protein PAPYR_221 [Paratrimastix pyriformis]|uniref:Uncharacterized protein n=1 Tax=Paratrimastix pyriformis TaxID=342808 RepID=A0ABQ8UV63_9EUKA|nr:hypothetical protein PAPYR_221 [Paratrimastix pyriformis]